MYVVLIIFEVLEAFQEFLRKSESPKGINMEHFYSYKILKSPNCWVMESRSENVPSDRIIFR